MSDKATLSDIATPRQAGRIYLEIELTKRRGRMHHGQVIRADLDLARRPSPPTSASAFLRRSASAREPSRARRKPRNGKPFRRRPPIPAWARASGRAGEGDPLFFAGAGLALLDAFLRRDPPAAGALRARLALQSAAASAKILRLNADEGALRDLRFAVGDDSARPRSCCRCGATSPAGRPASTPAGSLDAAARARPGRGPERASQPA